jgi:tetratricopeptide (TPR) repeat protein
MTTRTVIAGLFALLVSCINNDKSDKSLVMSGSGIMAFDNFTQEDFKNEEAFELFQEAIEESKSLNFNLAKPLLEQALILDPKNNIIHSSLGSIELQLGNYDVGIQHHRDAYELDSTYLEAFTNMAIGYNALKKYEKSIEICEFAIKRSTRRMVLCAANYNKSIARYELKNFDEAINDIGKAIELSDNENLTLMLEQIEADWVRERDLKRELIDAIKPSR